MIDKTKSIDISDRILILEISHKRHGEQISELKSEGKMLQEGLDKINKTISDIRNLIIGGVGIIFIQQFGIVAFVKTFFL